MTIQSIEQPRIVTELENLEVRRQIPAGTVLFREGQQPDGVYVVREGLVDLLYSSKSGAVRPLGAAVEGQILGLSGVLSGKPFDCTATARSLCTVGFVEKQAFLGLLDNNPALWFPVVQTISSDINSCWDCMRTLTSANAR